MKNPWSKLPVVGRISGAKAGRSTDEFTDLFLDPNLLRAKIGKA
jgi:hypothetical protein